MNIKNNILTRVLPVAVMAFIMVAAVAYQRGVYDLTFVERPVTDALTEHEETVPVTEPPITDAPETEDIPFVPSPLEYSYLISTFVESLGDANALLAEGYRVSDGEYGGDLVLARLTPSVSLPDSYSLRYRTEQFPERVPDETYNSYTTVMRDAVTERPAVELYMDYILVDNGETVDLLKNDGTLLVSGFDTDKYVPAYERDKKDRPLFIAEEPSRYNPKNTITQYYYLDGTGTLQKSDYSKASDGRGLNVNYPSYYGKTDNSTYRYYNRSAERYGYGGISGNMRTEHKYVSAFNFSEGFAAAVDEEGLMHFLGESLYAKINGQVQIYKNYNSARRRLLRHYIMPDTFGEESLGFFYFDHGLVRVRCQILDAYHYIERDKKYIASDEDILIRSDGTEFPTPTDYRVIAYSNGMILLEKDGKYGYMDHTGRWILQPIYDIAEPFYEGLAVVGIDGKVGMVDTNGDPAVPFAFDRIENASGGVIACYSEASGWLILNKLAPANAE